MIRRRQIQNKAPEIALEILSIIIAVLLALAVNEWREARKTDKLVATATDSLIGELWRNRKVLEANLPSHRDFRDTLGHLVTTPGNAPNTLEDLAFNPVFLRSSAWEAAMTTGAIAAMPYDKVSSFAEIYNYQNAYTTLMRGVMQASLSPSGSDLALQYQSWARTSTTIVLMEEQLLNIYTSFLDGDQTFASLLKTLRQGPEGSSTPNTSKKQD